MNDVPKDELISWDDLRRYSPARIALGHTGGSLPTRHLLKFRLDHAKARDAVDEECDWAQLALSLKDLFPEVLQLSSKASNRAVYLQRPDLGKILDEPSARLLTSTAMNHSDVCIVAADGLSAFAVERNFGPLVRALVPKLRENNFTFSPLCFVKGGRVAIGDEVGQRLNSDLVIVCIGERPGLSSTYSLGAYLTYNPKVGRTDESRNCVSNIRPGGLDHQLGAEKLEYLVKKSLRLRLSGVQLKDESDPRILSEQKQIIMHDRERWKQSSG